MKFANGLAMICSMILYLYQCQASSHVCCQQDGWKRSESITSSGFKVGVTLVRLSDYSEFRMNNAIIAPLRDQHVHKTGY